MNLLQLRTEVLAHGFDSIQYSSRINGYLNDAYNLVCRRTDYYVDEATQTYATVLGTASYPLPTNFARGRSVLDTDREVELAAVGLRDIDRSTVAQGTPSYYAFDGANLHLYPTPDGVHNLLFRYWLLPGSMVADTDTPTLPPDYHPMLAEYAIGRCYWGDDDPQTGQAWDQRFRTSLAQFQADQKFPNDDMPTRIASMWEGSGGLNQRGWSIYGSGG